MDLFDDYEDLEVDLDDIEFDLYDDGLEEMRIEQEIDDAETRGAVSALYGKYA